MRLQTREPSARPAQLDHPAEAREEQQPQEGTRSAIGGYAACARCYTSLRSHRHLKSGSGRAFAKRRIFDRRFRSYCPVGRLVFGRDGTVYLSTAETSATSRRNPPACAARSSGSAMMDSCLRTIRSQDARAIGRRFSRSGHVTCWTCHRGSTQPPLSRPIPQ